MFKVFLKFQVL